MRKYIYGREILENLSSVEMESWKGWLSFKFKDSFLLPTKGILVKVTSLLRHKTKENRGGLVSLYKDMEACGGYEDIQVMWDMVHSSPSLTTKHNIELRKTPRHQRFPSRPT